MANETKWRDCAGGCTNRVLGLRGTYCPRCFAYRPAGLQLTPDYRPETHARAHEMHEEAIRAMHNGRD